MTNKVIGISSIGLFLISTMAVSAQNDFKMRQKMTAAGRTMESAVMVKGARERTETTAAGVKSVTILQCDLKQMIKINDVEKKYMIEPFGTAASEAPQAKTTTTTKVKGRKGGLVTQTVELIDTGERKQIFGFTARRIKTVTSIDPGPDACEKDKMRMESDGWYIDLSPGLICKSERPERPDTYSDGGDRGCEDQHRVVQRGSAKLGYAINVSTKMGVPGMEGEDDPQVKAAMAQMGMAGGQMTMTNEVTELSKATLPQSLFEIPEGYTLITDPAKFYGIKTQMSAAENINKSGGMTSIMPPATAAATKRPGTVRVGVLSVGNSSGKQLNTGSYQQMLVSQISSEKVDAVAVSSEADALSKGCDYVLTTDVKALKQSAGGKIGGMFGKVTGTSTGGGKIEATVAYSLRGIVPAAPVSLQAEATAKVEGEEASVMSAFGTAAQAVMKAIKK